MCKWSYMHDDFSTHALSLEFGAYNDAGINAPATAPSAESIVETRASGVEPRGFIAHPEVTANRPCGRECAD